MSRDGTAFMFFATSAIGLWSLVAAWMLHTRRAPPGDVWGWSRVGNVLQGMGLLVLAFGFLLVNADVTLSGPVRIALRYLPWVIVGVGFGLRMRARRHSNDALPDTHTTYPPDDSR